MISQSSSNACGIIWDNWKLKGYPYDICAIQRSGYLTDNAPPSTRSCEMVKRWNEKYEWPKLRTAVATDFIKTVERDYAGRIPVIRVPHAPDFTKAVWDYLDN